MTEVNFFKNGNVLKWRQFRNAVRGGKSESAYGTVFI